MKRPEWTRYRVRLVLDEFRWKLPVAAAFLGTRPDALLELVLADARWRRLPSGRTTPLHPDTMSTSELREFMQAHGWNCVRAARALAFPAGHLRHRLRLRGLEAERRAAFDAAVAARREAAAAALAACDGNYVEAARRIGISPAAVRSRLDVPGYGYRPRRAPPRPPHCVPDDAEMRAALEESGWSRKATATLLGLHHGTVTAAVRRMREAGVPIPDDPKLRGPNALAARNARAKDEERTRILAALVETGWSKRAAGERLGMKPDTVYRRSRALGIVWRDEAKQGGVVRRLPFPSRKSPAKAA